MAETQPGGYYRVDGRVVDANGQPTRRSASHEDTDMSTDTTGTHSDADRAGSDDAAPTKADDAAGTSTNDTGRTSTDAENTGPEETAKVVKSGKDAK